MKMLSEEQHAGNSENNHSTNDATADTDNDMFVYMNGLNNEYSTEYIVGALPHHRNNPRVVPYGLFCEQISGTAFTISPRHSNKRTWMYRIQPSVAGRTYAPNALTMTGEYPYFGGCNPKDCVATIEPIRWNVPPPSTSSSVVEKLDFRTGMLLMCTGGDVSIKNGINIYMYTNVTESMSRSDDNEDEHLCNTDGDFLIVPQDGSLIIHTEFGRLYVEPTQICVIPRGITFQVNVASTTSARGYVLEISSATSGFQLPELGPIGSNGLANGRDFQIPVAWSDAIRPLSSPTTTFNPHVVYTKMANQLMPVVLNHTPYDVIAWHGNYVPYKYNLKHFCAINSVTYDHIDPSIYTVLTCPSSIVPGVALADFVIFPPRVMATDANTFRPPWFHKNTMSEYMGLIYGQYDAKVAGTSATTTGDDNDDATNTKRTPGSGGFVPGGASLHNCMTPHGPDEPSYVKGINDPCTVPIQLNTGMAFMFESYLPLRVSVPALQDPQWRDMAYNDTCWQSGTGLSFTNFTGWDLLDAKNNVDNNNNNNTENKKTYDRSPSQYRACEGT